MRLRWVVLGWLVMLSIVGHPLTVAAAPLRDPKADMRALDAKLMTVQTALAAGDLALARTTYAAFEDQWFVVEEGVSSTSKASYRAIENAMGDLKYALKQEPLNAAKTAAALEALHAANLAFLGDAAPAAPAVAPAASAAAPTLAGIMPQLTTALTALQGGDQATAAAAVATFRTAWPDVEGVVKTKSATAYRQAEDLMASAADQISSGQTAAAISDLTTLQTTLAPYSAAKLSYTVFDAASILLREGLEALLVIAALLAFLKKSGNADKRHWVWGGGIVGIVASMATAIAIYALFRTFVTGTNRELIEGITGLVAAGMLFYVSYWLHSKTSIGGWQKYLKDQTSAAIARGSLINLGILAFLSVFREGAETALFYIGIAPSIALRDLLLGLAIGMVTLTVIGVLVIGMGVRIPLSQFFRVASLLIWYLGFKFIGGGIHALQVAGVVPATTASYLPNSELLGMFPTWETTLPQLALVALAITIVVTMRIRTQRLNHPRPAHA